LLAWLSGADYEVLTRVRTDRAKYIGIGSVIVVTGAMACVSMSFALHTVLMVPLPFAIPFAVAWGLAIMTLDRVLVVSLRRGESWWGYVIPVFLRVLIALVLGAVISTPFTLQIFRPEIEGQLTVIHAQNAADFAHQQTTNALGQKISQLTARQQQLTAIIRNGGVPPAGQASQVSSLMGQLRVVEDKENSAYQQWQCQLYGGAGCTVAGNGPLAAASKAAYEQDVHQVGVLNTEIRAAEAAAVTNARSQLTKTDGLLQAEQAEQNSLAAAFTKANAVNGGLLIRLKALDQVASQDVILDVARWLLFALFVLFELLPVVIKILTIIGDPTSYDSALEAEDDALRTISRQFSQDYRDERLKLSLQIARDKAQAERRVDLDRLGVWEARQVGGPAQSRRRRPVRMRRWTGRPRPSPVQARASAPARSAGIRRGRERAERNANTPIPPPRPRPAGDVPPRRAGRRERTLIWLQELRPPTGPPGQSSGNGQSSGPHPPEGPTP
jgi:hypothetical protein